MVIMITRTLSYILLIILMFFQPLNGMFQDEDFVDTDSELVDYEASLKCDACNIVSNKFIDYFLKTQSEVDRVTLTTDEVVDAVEATCDDAWDGYGVKLVDHIMRLSGPGGETDVMADDGDVEEDPALWTRRLQDMCDELLAESPDENTIYKQWSGNSEALATYLCKGDGTFGACASSTWGPWPGDDYEDYDDDNFEYAHDEF